MKDDTKLKLISFSVAGGIILLIVCLFLISEYADKSNFKKRDDCVTDCMKKLPKNTCGRMCQKGLWAP
jgi:hypothetical protein